MEDILGVEWFTNHFLKHCGPQRPQLIMLDSHCSHETLGLIENARKHNIILFAFPPHTTQWFCPLDKTIFGPLSREYNKVCTDFMSLSPNNLVGKWEWPNLFRMAYDKVVTKANIKAGFEKCGIQPLNQRAIPKNAFAPSIPFDRNQGHLPSFESPPVLEAMVPGPGDAHLEHDMFSIESVLDLSLANWNASVDAIFNTPSVPNTTPPKPTKKLTSHRILTSDEIYEQKKEEKERKENEERVKQEKKKAREEKRKLKEIEKDAKKKKKSTEK